VSAPLVAVSLGCPAGIGPEVSVAGAARAKGVRALLVGDPDVVRRAAERVGVRRPVVLVDSARAAELAPARALLVWSASVRLGGKLVPRRPDRAAGAAQLAWVDQATDLVTHGVACALATGPVSKLAIATSGAPGSSGFLGHTEHLATRLGAREVTMAFHADALVVALVTTHLSLRDVPDAITRRGVARATYWLARLLIAAGIARPRIAVAALNPHAGEGGLLGHEETRTIAPGIALCRARLLRDRAPAELAGPIGAETAFRVAARGGWDGVVAMYHDQATIPSKLVAFGDAVNVSLGLPIVRTSVDHGTAYDVAWTGRADPAGMIAALELAGRLATAKRPPTESRRGRRSSRKA
jgi:4-hydroxythreonine-4-phosphate dehydrogenase